VVTVEVSRWDIEALTEAGRRNVPGTGILCFSGYSCPGTDARGTAVDPTYEKRTGENRDFGIR
jgi:hypothetical protein